jgi:SAM-dependent methyltransferase
VTTGPQPRADHYSYSVYADRAMAESFEHSRFGGPIGRLLAETQEGVLARFLAPVSGTSVLDVGTGTGRAAIALAGRGAIVTGVDASAEMLAVARERARAANVTIAFEQGDVHGLRYADRSFDAVVCLRVLMHTPDWRSSLAELCRVARQRVVFDYPALASAAALQAATRHLAHAAGARVEAYRVFSDRSIAEALAANGYRRSGSHRQFVLPIALHKRLGSLEATRRIEGALAKVGLLAAFGSPVTVVAQRCES